MLSERMLQMAQRPFRKIKVKEHLNPGPNPTELHCLQGKEKLIACFKNRRR
jgi:hypothetical protein